MRNRGERGPRCGLPAAHAPLPTATQPPRGSPRWSPHRPARPSAARPAPPGAAPAPGTARGEAWLREGLHRRGPGREEGRKEGGNEAALAPRVGGEAGAGPPRSAKDSPDRPGHFPRRFGPGPGNVAQR